MARRLLKIVVVALLLTMAAIAIPPVRHALLRSAGQLMTGSDAAQPADLIAMDNESYAAGALMVADLHRANRGSTVGLLVPRPNAFDAELERRGIRLPNTLRLLFDQLGVPDAAIEEIAAGEGGTTESTGALADWAQQHPGKRVLVVVGPSHGRRYRRALRRAWPGGIQPPAVVTTTYGLFRADDWWTSRPTLREGLVELEKLVLDFVQHPF